ncbi:MAG: MATE family efflux transporter [Bacteroidales bacterium]|nr:MATE family efflux transporter [Bacteroidales bacterium]
MSKKDNHKLLTEGPVSKAILSMAFPAIISMLVTSIYSIISTFYVGRISTQATAAVGVSFSAMSVIQAIAFMFGQGSGNFISRELGARNSKSSAEMAVFALVLSMLSGVVLGIAGILFLKPLSVLLGSTPTILPDTMSYMFYVLAATPFIMGAIVLNNQMRFEGNAAYAMWGIISGALLNVVLAPILIFVFGMGVSGAGIATLAGQAFSFFVLQLMHRKADGVRLDLRNLRWSGKYFREILAGGTPSLTRQGLASISVALLNNTAGIYGDGAIAGMSIVGRITFIFLAVTIGLGHGFQPLCGFSYGAGLYGRVRQGFYFVLKLGTALMLAFALVGIFFSEPLVGFFRNDPAVIEVGSAALRWQMATLALVPFVMYTNMMLQTTRHPWEANIMAMSRNGLFFIPAILILPLLLGLQGVEMAQAVADVLSAILAAIVITRFFRKLPS